MVKNLHRFSFEILFFQTVEDKKDKNYNSFKKCGDISSRRTTLIEDISFTKTCKRM